jgi:arylformamidase
VTDLEREYSPSSRVGGSADPFIEDYRARSARACVDLGEQVRALPGGTLLVESSPGAPLLVFVHGGYWQALSAAASMYLAPGALASGWSYAAVEYTLAPAGNLPTMVEECAQALVHAAAAARPSAIVLAGHSAGAHLAAMVSIVANAPVAIDRSILVSGVFDLRPLVQTSVNDVLGIDLDTAAASSPAFLPIGGHPAVTVIWGDNDTEAFKWQGAAYADRLQSAGLRVDVRECVGRHHFDVVEEITGYLT